MIPVRLMSVALGALALGACATAPEPASGFLSAYEDLEARTDTIRASARQTRDEGAAAAIERVRLEPTVLVEGAAPDLTPAEQALVLGEIDRQVCYELSERFTIAAPDDAGAGRVRTAATRISPTGRAGSAASAVANYFIPGPIGVRAPGTTGGLAAEAELLTAEGEQAAAIVWARDANVVGTDSPSLSRVGDAHQLAGVFGEMVGEAFAPEGREARAIPDPDPCIAFGPRNRPVGFVTRLATGLYTPALSGGTQREEEPEGE